MQGHTLRHLCRLGKLRLSRVGRAKQGLPHTAPSWPKLQPCLLLHILLHPRPPPNLTVDAGRFPGQACVAAIHHPSVGGNHRPFPGKLLERKWTESGATALHS